MNHKQLRPFNPATASIGDPIITFLKDKGTYRGCTSNQEKCMIEYENTSYHILETRLLFQPPLCYIEDKPVYVGDTLYIKDLFQYHIVTGKEEENLTFKDCGRCYHDNRWNNLTWTKPKVMVTKTGFMSCYKDVRDNIVYPTRDEAETMSNTVVEITWQQES